MAVNHFFSSDQHFVVYLTIDFFDFFRVVAKIVNSLKTKFLFFYDIMHDSNRFCIMALRVIQ